jgi:hypothetical protein
LNDPFYKGGPTPAEESKEHADAVVAAYAGTATAEGTAYDTSAAIEKARHDRP